MWSQFFIDNATGNNKDFVKIILMTYRSKELCELNSVQRMFATFGALKGTLTIRLSMNQYSQLFVMFFLSIEVSKSRDRLDVKDDKRFTLLKALSLQHTYSP